MYAKMREGEGGWRQGILETAQTQIITRFEPLMPIGCLLGSPMWL
jgi:hypothetical protein